MVPTRFSTGGIVDLDQDVIKTRYPPTELVVERIPALVREGLTQVEVEDATNPNGRFEVDTLMQTLVQTPLSTGSEEALEASDELIQRADAVDTFCRSLRSGPLQEIVAKQVARLREAALHLRSPSSRLNAANICVEKPRTRPVPVRVTPFMGSALARAAAKVGVSAKNHHGANSVLKAAKPLYKWEKRRLLRGSNVAQPNVAGSKTNAGRKPKLAEDYLDGVDEAGTELHPCSEPGHYSRSSYKASTTTEASRIFEFQIVLTEEELKALKYQRRRLEAEQKHLSRQTVPPAPTAIARKLPQ